MIKYLNFDLNIQLTNYIIDSRTSTIIGFIDPRTNKKYMKTNKDFYERKNVMNHLFNKHRHNDLVWKNQSISQISVLYAKHEMKINHEVMKSYLTLSDWHRYDKQKRTAMMCRRDDGFMLENNEQPDGIMNTHTLDEIKCCTAVGLERDEPWIIPNCFDTWRYFNFTTDHELPMRVNMETRVY